jgi:hypothetical protein
MQKLDATILKKFDELADKAKKVNTSQQVTDIAVIVDSKKFQDWATGSLALLQKVFGEKSAYYTNFQTIYSKIINIPYKESFDKCRAILQSAREEFEGASLSEIRRFLDHAVLEHLAKSTTEYLRRGDKQTACILAVVLLENALQYLCTRRGVAQGSLEEMNEALYKAGAYQVGTQQRIKDWGYMKEDFIKCEGEKYRVAEVDDMLRGVQRFIAKELEVS